MIRKYRYTVCIKAKFSPEILERILRVIRHRGFEIYKIYMNRINNHFNIKILIIVISERNFRLLSSQIYKIVNVYYVCSINK